MDAEELYTEMKNALSYFGLRFNEKGKMHVGFGDGFVIFSHGSREVAVNSTDSDED